MDFYKTYQIIALLTFCAFWVIVARYPKIRQIDFSISLKKADYLVFSGLFFFFLIFTFPYLITSLNSDELIHLRRSQPAFYDFLNSNSIFDGWSAKTILRLVNIFHLIILLLLGLMAKKFPRGRFYIAAFAILFFRKYLWMSVEPHPPFRLILLWPSTAIFGLNNFGAHFPEYCAYQLLLFIIYKKLEYATGKIRAVIACLYIGSLSVLLHVSTLLEFSIYSTLATSAVLLLFTDGDDEDEKKGFSVEKFTMASWIIGIGALVRLPVFLLSFPLAGLLSYQWHKESHDSSNPKKPYPWFALFPLVIMLPFVFKSLYLGTPATYLPDEIYAYLPARQNIFKRIYYAIGHGDILFISFKQMGSFALVLALFVFVPKRKDLRPHVFFYLSIFLFLILAFYGIRPGHWGMGRYQAEIWVPFTIVGVVKLLRSTNKPWIKKCISQLLIVMTCYQLYQFQNIFRLQPVPNLTQAFNQHYWILSKSYYDWDKALTFAKKDHFYGATLLIGDTPNLYPFVLNDASIGELKKEKLLFDKYKNRENLEEINRDIAVSLVLVASTPCEYCSIPKDPRVNLFLARGWKIWKRVPGDLGNFEIVGLVRK